MKIKKKFGGWGSGGGWGVRVDVTEKCSFCEIIQKKNCGVGVGSGWGGGGGVRVGDVRVDVNVELKFL